LGDPVSQKNLELLITAREKDLGGFTVRRILPYATHRMVGPFIFFDHMGPAVFPPGQGMEVRPHPHIHLATVTYLFEGAIQHKDSLGSDVAIEPGAINWMTAGHGIVHSERTPKALLETGLRMNGIQLWVALPTPHENVAPTFAHHPSNTLPEFNVGEVRVKLLLGEAFGHTSPVRVHSELFYLETSLPAGADFAMPLAAHHEGAFYLESGELAVEGETISACTMGIAKTGASLKLTATKDSRVMWIGGAPVGERFIFWNFVSSSKAQIEEAKRDWARGPGQTARFPLVPGDEIDFIPLPPAPSNPRGTIL
jgi:hypothetical protein